MCIEPLRKRTVSGKLYTRRDEISAFIRLSLDWPFDELLDKAAMRDRRHADYVPSEVLLYHLRQTKTDNADGRFVALYNILPPVPGPTADAAIRMSRIFASPRSAIKQ